MSALDKQVGGQHYKGMVIQPMEYSMKNGLDACQHTAIKYITRFREKNGLDDLDKAIHCIEMLKEFYQAEQKKKLEIDQKPEIDRLEKEFREQAFEAQREAYRILGV
jgi:hypothetical protein